MKQSFEDFLKQTHVEDEPMTLDDDLPDAFDAWLGELDKELMILYADKWGAEQRMAEVKSTFSELRAVEAKSIFAELNK